MTVAYLVAHIVWATRHRDPILLPSLDEWLKTTLNAEAALLRAEVLAEGNAPDHVHVLVRYAPSVAVAQVAQRFKGVLSRRYNGQGVGRLDWQIGYWVESVGAGDLALLRRHIDEQRDRHQLGTELEAWESCPIE